MNGYGITPGGRPITDSPERHHHRWPAAPHALTLAAISCIIAACDPEARAVDPAGPDLVGAATLALAEEVRTLTAGRGIGPLERPPRVRPELVRLGQALAFDPILSGNRDISCMTCHLPGLGTGDGRSLSIGQGATGLGLDRSHPAGAFIPRNAPSFFNLFANPGLFWDGRVAVDEAGRLQTPAEERVTAYMRRAFEFGALSALPLFPVLSREEMRAATGNELADIKDKSPQQVWRALMDRLGAIPEYRRMFEEAYPGTRFASMHFGHASNAIAGFLIDQFAFTDSPWDRFLAGDDDALTETELRGAKNFMSARCSICHNGPEQRARALGQPVPQRGRGPDRPRRRRRRRGA